MLRAPLLAVLLALPAASALLPGPAVHATDVPLFLRVDPDGGRTLVVWLEDEFQDGQFQYRRTANPGGELREVGTYYHPWTHMGLPEVTFGVYAITVREGLLRVPLLVLENVPTESAFAAAVQDAALRYGANPALTLVPFVQEMAAPEMADPKPGDLRLAEFQEFPAMVAWHARRALPGAELWLGAYVDRDGEVRATPGGAEGVRSSEAGVVARLDGRDTRMAGVFVEQRASLDEQGGQRTMSTTVTAGASGPAGRVPLLSVRGDESRGGLVARPDAQRNEVALGLQMPWGFVPLAGLRTDVHNRYHSGGIETTRTTALGAYPLGQWTPLAGLRYHADRTPLLDMPNALLRGGTLGSNASGDAELSVGHFAGGSYAPLLQVALDDAFADGRHRHQTMVTLGAHTPLRYLPLASATYDGTESLVDWATRIQRNQERGTAWMVSAGPWAGQLYLPVVGVRFRGDAPGAEQPHEVEVAAGTFAIGYPSFLPLASASASSDETFVNAASRAATQGLGNQGGTWQAGVGSYPIEDRYAPLAHVAYAPVQDPEAPAASDVVVRVAGRPALGVQYRGETPMVQSLNAPSNLADDRPWRITAGAYGPAGFVPLLRLAHDGKGSTVVVGPDL